MRTSIAVWIRACLLVACGTYAMTALAQTAPSPPDPPPPPMPPMDQPTAADLEKAKAKAETPQPSKHTASHRSGGTHAKTKGLARWRSGSIKKKSVSVSAKATSASKRPRRMKKGR